MADAEKVFVVFKGIPARFTDLTLAEEYAAELSEKTRTDHTIAVMDREILDFALVARYLGVRLMTIEEATRGDES